MHTPPPRDLRLSRRAFALGVAAAAVARPAAAEDADVVIIGAGAAGIGAARALQAAGKRFILIEARARAGGRLWTNTDWASRSMPERPTSTSPTEPLERHRQ